MSNAVQAIRNRGPVRLIVIAVLVIALVGAVILLWPGSGGNKVTAYFKTAVGIYPGDEVRIVGVPVGQIDSIEPQAESVKITMSIDKGISIADDAQAIIMAPNIVSSRFIQFTPPYKGGKALPDGAVLQTDRTAVPVEWDQIKTELTKLTRQIGPDEDGKIQGPLVSVVNQAADFLDGNGDSFRQAIRQLSQTAGRLGDSREDLFGTIKNLQILVDALSNSNEQIVQFSSHLASVSQVLADASSDLDGTLGTLNQALTDVRGFLGENNATLVASVDKLAGFTQILSDQSENLEQILHVAPNGLANFYNIYNPAQGTLAGLLSLPNFANPVQFICGGSFDVGADPEYYKRAEICRERMGPVLRRISMNFPPLLFHPINSITAYKGQVIYDTPGTQAKAQTPVPNLQWQPNPGVIPPVIPPGGDITSLMLPPTPGPGAGPPAAALPGTGGGTPGPGNLPGMPPGMPPGAGAVPGPPFPLPAEQPIPAPGGGG